MTTKTLDREQAESEVRMLLREALADLDQGADPFALAERLHWRFFDVSMRPLMADLLDRQESLFEVPGGSEKR